MPAFGGGEDKRCSVLLLGVPNRNSVVQEGNLVSTVSTTLRLSSASDEMLMGHPPAGPPQGVRYAAEALIVGIVPQRNSKLHGDHKGAKRKAQVCCRLYLTYLLCDDCRKCHPIVGSAEDVTAGIEVMRPGLSERA
jgi:hypothetical protein